MLASEKLTVEGANVLIMISILSLIGWFAGLCRRIFSAYELNLSVSSVSLLQKVTRFSKPDTSKTTPLTLLSAEPMHTRYLSRSLSL
jgi:hypothetical protein